MGFHKTLLIGSRGAGKTALLSRWPDKIKAVDLDQEIEKQEGLLIFEIFANKGEEAFRQFEVQELTKLLLSATPMVIAVGAGFRWDGFKFPLERTDVEIIWVRRPTDHLGRIFLNRPRLELAMDPLEEFKTRHLQREKQYLKMADRIYTMPEGIRGLDSLENEILKNEIADPDGILTLTEKNQKWQWPGRIEIRTDLWDSEKIQSFQFSKVIWSLRDLGKVSTIQKVIRDSDWLDWPLELGEKSLVSSQNLILSLHELHPKESIEEGAKRLEGYKAWHLKFCPIVTTWNELEQGWNWQQQDPENRSFLPRSEEGHWNWFRLWAKSQQKINFVQDGVNPVQDQPTFYQWLATPKNFKYFAAVLGSPVFHSRSPVEQGAFFRAQGWPFFAIPIPKEVWNGAILFLTKLGLRAAAVTAPLKKEFDPERSLNTIYWNENHAWQGTNTDEDGLKVLLGGLDSGTTVIWGGGGTLDAIQKILPAPAYSVRSGEPRSSIRINHPKTLVWAAGPRDPSPLNKNLDSWRPQVVIDLNYREDSEARSYALAIGAKYQSGDLMFHIQAEGQRQFWKIRMKP